MERTRAAFMRQRFLLGIMIVVIWAGLLLFGRGLELATTVVVTSIIDSVFLAWTFVISCRENNRDGFILSSIGLNVINVLALYYRWEVSTVVWLGVLISYTGSVLDKDGLFTEF